MQSILQNENDVESKIVSDLNNCTQAIVKPLGEQKCAVRRQEVMVILANVGVLSTGMALALPSVTLNQFQNSEEHVHFTDSQVGWFASLHMLSCPLGGLLSGYLLDKFGRKNTLYAVNVLALTAWIIMALTIQNDSNSAFAQLMVSRFIIGISSGLATAPTGVYSAEISLPRIRSRLILGASLAVAAGITLMYIMGYFIRNDWHLISLLCCSYQLMALICVIPLPETPSWLLSKGRVQEAIISMNFFRGLSKTTNLTHPEVINEFNVLQKSIQLRTDEKHDSFWFLLKLPEVYKPVLILIALFAFQQLTGIFIIVVYAVQIANDTGVTIDSFLCAIMIGLARVITTCFMGIILERWGRRRSGLISALGMAMCIFLLISYNWFDWLHLIPYLQVIAIVTFIILSTLGIYTLPFFMISELFPQKVRGPASGLCVAIGMFISFVCIKVYPYFRHSIGINWCLAIFGFNSLFAAVFVYFALPETRGRTLLEIEEYFRSGKTKRSHLPTTADIEMQEATLLTKNNNEAQDCIVIHTKS